MSNRDKYKTRAELEQFVQSYYEHRETGYKKECFPDCSAECVEFTRKKLKKDHPDLFETMSKADRIYLKHWEKLNLQAASGVFVDGSGKGEKHGLWMNSTNIIFALKNIGWVDDAKDIQQKFTINVKQRLAAQLNSVKLAIASGQIQSTQAARLIDAITSELSVQKDEKLIIEFEERLSNLERHDEKKLDAKC